MSPIHVVAALVTDPDGRVLVVRKRGTEMFMNPGGKPEAGESELQALCRELAEEIGLDVAEADLVKIGRFVAPAANEPGRDVDAQVFRLRLADSRHQVGAEIEQSRWIDSRDPGDVPLAPLAVDHLLPLLLMSDPPAMENT